MRVHTNEGHVAGGLGHDVSHGELEDRVVEEGGDA